MACGKEILSQKAFGLAAVSLKPRLQPDVANQREDRSNENCATLLMFDINRLTHIDASHIHIHSRNCLIPYRHPGRLPVTSLNADFPSIRA